MSYIFAVMKKKKKTKKPNNGKNHKLKNKKYTDHCLTQHTTSRTLHCIEDQYRSNSTKKIGTNKRKKKKSDEIDKITKLLY